MEKVKIRVRLDATGQETILGGRDAWCLKRLLAAGDGGCTPMSEPAPRWSEYVSRLRGHGFDIETVWEHHGGPFAGRHGRYVLRSSVTTLEDCEAI